MLGTQLAPELYLHFHDWVNGEWQRCSQLRGSFENHAVSYLVTTNGGGAAAVIAFAGSAGYGTPDVFRTLWAFLIGVILAGIAIAIGLERMSWITRRLGEDHRAFNSNQMGTRQLDENHSSRFRKRWYGEVFGYLSFASLLTGIALSVVAFDGYITFKAEKAAAEKAAAEKTAAEFSAVVSQQKQGATPALTPKSFHKLPTEKREATKEGLPISTPARGPVSK